MKIFAPDFPSLSNRYAFFKIFAILFSISLLISSPVIVGNTYYLDDYYRLISGEASFWMNNGRPLTTWLIQFFSFSTIITDTSPFILIIGLAALACSLIFSLSRLTGERPALILALSLTVVLCPFQAQPMLYAYDALPILLAVSLSFVACVNIGSHPGKQIVFSTLTFLCAICFYQTTINHALINIIFLSALALHRSSGRLIKPAKYISALAASLLTSMIIYRLLVVPYYVTDPLNKARGAMLPFEASSIDNIVRNAATLFKAVHDAFPGISALPVVTIALAGTIACWKIGLRQLQLIKEKPGQLLSALLCLMAPIFTGFLVAGFLMMMNWPTTDPRVLTAFSSALIFYFYLAYLVFPRLRAALALLLVVHLWFSAVFMLATFRATVSQARFDEGMAINLRGDLSRLGQPNIDRIIIIGHSPLAPSVQPALRNYPLARKIIVPAISENNAFHYYAFANRFFIYTPLGETTENIKSYKPAQIVSSNCLYRLYQYKHAAILDFNTPACSVAQDFNAPLLSDDY